MVCEYATDLSLDVALGVLGAGPRRRALRDLIDEPNGVSVAELADRLHTDRRSSVPAGPEEEATRLDRRIGMVHVHIPLLEATGVVEFDPRSRTVVATEAASALAPLLNAADVRTAERERVLRRDEARRRNGVTAVRKRYDRPASGPMNTARRARRARCGARRGPRRRICVGQRGPYPAVPSRR